MTLDGDIALVTGASRGIGMAIAKALGEQGAFVVGTTTTESGAASIGEALRGADIEGFGAALDVSDSASVTALFERLESESRNPTILINNAGITRDNLLARMSEDEYQAELDGLKSRAQARIDELISASSFDGESVVHVGKNSPSLAIREAVEHLHPDLLVMGTVSRGGIAGFLVGNTAEKLLDQVDCSMLTVKPRDFVCPVELS